MALSREARFGHSTSRNAWGADPFHHSKRDYLRFECAASTKGLREWKLSLSYFLSFAALLSSERFLDSSISWSTSDAANPTICALCAAHGAVPNESREKQERLGILLKQNSNARYVIIFRGIFPSHRPLGTPSGQNGTQYMTCSN